MASLSFCSNWPTFTQLRRETVVPQPLEMSPFHDNFTLFEPNNSNFSTFNNSFTNFPIQNSIKYPTLSASYNPISQEYYSNPLSTNVFAHEEFFPLQQMQPEYYSFLPNVFDSQEFSPMEEMQIQIQPEYCPYNSFDSYPLIPDVCEQMDPEHCLYNSYYSYPLVPNVYEQMQPELLTFPEIYQYGNGSEDETAMSYDTRHGCNVVNLGENLQVVENSEGPLPEIYQNGIGSEDIMDMSYDIGHGCDVVNLGESLQTAENGEGEERKLSAQSLAARLRRRKISEKTTELGKLVPGGHRMTTAEMFQAASKYIKFMQAQVSVLQHIGSSPGRGEELQALITNTTVQEKLYTAGKCIVTEELGKTLADNPQGTKINITN